MMDGYDEVNRMLYEMIEKPETFCRKPIKIINTYSPVFTAYCLMFATYCLPLSAYGLVHGHYCLLLSAYCLVV
jgi:hypothetical protein